MLRPEYHPCEVAALLRELRRCATIIPICCYCHRTRDAFGSWQQREVHSLAAEEVTYSHGICPACMREHYPELWQRR